MDVAPKAPLEQYRQWVLFKVTHNLPESTVSVLLDPSKSNIIDFHEAIAPFEKRSPTTMRFDIPADQLHSLNENLIDMYKRFADSVVSAKGERTFANTFLPDIREVEADGLDIDFLAHVSDSKEIRDVANECSQRVSEFAVELSSRKDIYEAQKAFAETEEYKKLSPEQKRYVDFTIRDARRRGLDLEGEARESLIRIKKRMSTLAIEFSKNLGEDDSHIFLSESQLRGLSSAHLNRFEKKEEGGKTLFKVTMKYPDYVPCMEQCRDGNTRKLLAKIYSSRCKDTNGPIIEELVNLRAELADLLKYPNHASWVQEVRMAKNPKTVLNFLSDLNEKLTPSYHSELSELLAIKKREFEKDKKDGLIPADEEFDGLVNSWDRTWLSQLYEMEKFAIDHEALSEYFPIEKVQKGLFEIYEKLLGLRFVKVDLKGKAAEDEAVKNWVWHEEVDLYEVRDRDNNEKTIGYFFMDLHPRQGKYGHAAVFGLVKAAKKSPFKFFNCDVTTPTEGDERRGRQLPVCSLVCNFPKPTADRPALLPHKDVVTFFHEFGHAMHQVCTEVDIPRFSGTAVERDFVEAPSQMLENWCYESEALELMNEHYKTKDKISSELITQLNNTKTSLPAIFSKRQLTFALLDQKIHTRPWSTVVAEGGKTIDSALIFKQVQKEVMEIDEQEGTNFVATFGHLAGGYDATYYGYLWSEVYAADMFVSRFLKEGVLNEKAGRDYRRWVLAKGGSIDGIDMLKGFLGRDPQPNAFLELKGLKA